MQVIRQHYSVILTTHATSTITVVSLKEDYPQRPTTAGCHLKIIRVTLHVRCSGGLSWRDKDSRVRRQHKHPIVTRGASGTTQISEGTRQIKTCRLLFFFVFQYELTSSFGESEYDSAVDKIDERASEDEKVQLVSLWRVYD